MLSRDFTLKKYQELCEAITASECASLRVVDYFKNGTDKFIIIRHDVDREAENALKIAQIEHAYGLLSTYYFRKTKEVFIPSIIKKISGLGHEIGYHYEVLDKTNGDVNKAIKLFEEELDEFRALVKVETICMHGNPLKSWCNKDIWQSYNFHDFRIIGEPYLSIDYTKVLYLSDTGRRWDGRYNVKDLEINNLYKIRNTNDLINLIKNGKIGCVFLTTHPNRWNDDFTSWSKELIFQNLKNLGKAGILFYRTLMNNSLH
jgi:hypothetical protein